jgi:hypothetical protein
LLLAGGLLFNAFLLWLYHHPEAKTLFGDENYYYGVARTLAGGGDVTPNPLWPTLYAHLVGIVFKWAGTNVLPVQLIQIGMWIACAAFVFKIALHISRASAVALGAMGLFLLSPETAAFSHYLWPEVPHMFFFLAALWVVMSRGGTLTGTFIGGVLIGLALWSKLLLLPFIPAFLVFAHPGRALFRRWKQGLLFIAGIVLVLTPTMLSNAETHGRFMVADSSVFNLWVGLNDVETQDFRNDIAGHELRKFRRAAPDFKGRNEAFRAKTRELLRRQGLVKTIRKQVSKQYFRLFDHETFLTTQLPGGPRSSYNYDAPTITAGLRLYSHVFHAFLLAAAAFGLMRLRFLKLGWPQFLALVLLFNLALFLFVHVKTRYLMQLVPVFAIFGAISLHAGWCRVRGVSVPENGEFRSGRGRLVAGTGLMLLLEWLAFASLL